MSLHQPKSPVTGFQSNEVPANDNKEEVDHAKKKGGLSAFQWFIIGALIFGFCVIGLALGLGLGLGLKKTSPSSVVMGSTSNGNFNYSSFYGIPDNLPVISNNLTNTDELELRGLVDSSIVTGKSKFSITDPPQVRNYVFNITQVLAAPDGYQKPMIAINGQFPGPLVEGNKGDTFVINVFNSIANWSTTIHWHGIKQTNSTWMDGVAGVTQCGIPPGQNFTYTFTVDQAGTFWYHSHLSTQYTDGEFGPLIIHDPDATGTMALGVGYDEEKILFTGDWYHTYSSVLLEQYMGPDPVWYPPGPGTEPLPDTILMNGHNTFNCSVPPGLDPQSNYTTQSCTGGELYNLHVQSGKSYRLRLINPGSYAGLYFSIDSHNLTIIEADGTDITPIEVPGIYVNIGQRYSVIFKANETVGNYLMRATIQKECFFVINEYTNPALASIGYEATAIMTYDNVSSTAAPIGTKHNTTNPYNGTCGDVPPSMLVPVNPESPGDVPPENMLYITYGFYEAQQVQRIMINQTAWYPYKNTTSLDVAMGQTWSPQEAYTFSPSNFILSITNDSYTQLVVNSQSNDPHPFHLHGHDFWIVGQGQGLYNGTTQLNLDNPTRRDTITIPPESHMIIRWKSDNPGIWVFHCHIAWHMEAGMLVQFAELPDLINSMNSSIPHNVEGALNGFCSYEQHVLPLDGLEA